MTTHRQTDTQTVVTSSSIFKLLGKDLINMFKSESDYVILEYSLFLNVCFVNKILLISPLSSFLEKPPGILTID